MERVGAEDMPEDAERVVIGKCPRCGEAVYEGKKNTAETGPALHENRQNLRYDGTVLLADTGGKYVNYRVWRKRADGVT